MYSYPPAEGTIEGVGGPVYVELVDVTLADVVVEELVEVVAGTLEELLEVVAPHE
jgi:hypothetical protein